MDSNLSKIFKFSPLKGIKEHEKEDASEMDISYRPSNIFLKSEKEPSEKMTPQFDNENN